MIKTARAENPDTILNLGTQAPYMGVLVDPSTYRQYTIDRIEAQDFKSNLGNYIKCETTPQISLFSSTGLEITIAVGLASLIAGMAIGHQL